ncbi:polymer-forming cytoskeletal protein [Candidatus Auribacterota bacterium]
MWQNKTNINYKHFKTAESKKSDSPLEQTSQTKIKQKTVICPHCELEQSFPESAMSGFCKKCNKRITLTDKGGSGKSDKNTSSQNLRSVGCTKCKSRQSVPNNALSSFCKKCGARINLQNYEIKSKFNGELSTKGTLFVRIGGDVKADVNVGNAVIEGKLKGTITAEGHVELKSTAKIYGEIFTPKLIVNDGALFVGQSHVPPDTNT